MSAGEKIKKRRGGNYRNDIFLVEFGGDICCFRFMAVVEEAE
jgi:hypothetical protein